MRMQKILSIVFGLYLVQLVVWPTKRFFKLFKCGELAMYLFGGIAICGGLGIVFAWFSDSFDFKGAHVLNAMIVFVPSIVGTSFFDLIFALCHKRSTMPIYIALWLIVLSLVLLLVTAVAYFQGLSNPRLIYLVWAFSLVYWTVVNADDEKFSLVVNPNNTEGGDAMRKMSGKDSIEGVES